MQALAEQSRIVRLPLNRVGMLHKIYKESVNLEQAFHREPTAAELAVSLSLTEREVELNISIRNRQISVDASIGDGEGASLLDLIPSSETPAPDADLLAESLSMEIAGALSRLNEREREVICSYYGLNRQALTLDELASRFDLTRERVRQIKERATHKLRAIFAKRSFQPIAY
jgi:RNA polymerase primary sigma factor